MEKIAKHYLSADDYLHDVWKLAASVRKSGWQPDILIALWRGGGPAGIALHEFFTASGWSVDHLPLKTRSYTGIGANAGNVEIIGEDVVDARIRPGSRVLVVDDIFDTGKTAAAVIPRLAARGAEVRLACVYWKPLKNTTALRPDYFVRDVGSDWLVFPHEIDGLSPDEIAEKDPFLAGLLAGMSA